LYERGSGRVSEAARNGRRISRCLTALGNLKHTNYVYTGVVKNITLSADDDLIERAREKARKQKTTLNAAFREWLKDYTGRRDRGREYDELMQRLSYVRAGRKFTREEMNSRD
jgi:hypothetical protein